MNKKTKKLRPAAIKPLSRRERENPDAHTVERLARRSGHTIEQLYALWLKGRSGDQEADQKVRSLMASDPDIDAAFSVFIQAQDPRRSGQLRKRLQIANPKKGPESIWAKAKARWISVVEGGLPSLGKRK